MKGFSACFSGIFSTVVVAVCINLWFLKCILWAPMRGFEYSYVAITRPCSPQKNTVLVVVLVKTCYFLWIHLPPQQGLSENPGLDWNLHLLPSKEGFAAVARCEYSICSELIFLLWGLPAHSLSHLYLFSLICIYISLYISVYRYIHILSILLLPTWYVLVWIFFLVTP